jgi:hypothetical protein
LPAGPSVLAETVFAETVFADESGVAVTRYSAIGSPPSDAGASQVTTRWPPKAAELMAAGDPETTVTVTSRTGDGVRTGPLSARPEVEANQVVDSFPGGDPEAAVERGAIDPNVA